MALGSRLVVCMLTVVACGGCGPPPITLPCSADHLVEYDLSRWERDLRALASAVPVASSEQVNAHLAKVRLTALPDAGPPPEGSAEASEESFALESSHLVRMRQGAMEKRLSLLVSRFTNRSGAVSTRAAVYSPVVGRSSAYCPVGGADLSRDFSKEQQPTLAVRQGDPLGRSIEVLPLESEDVDGLVIVDREGQCCGEARGAKIVATYAGVSADGFVEHATGTLYEAWYRSPEPPDSEVLGRFTLGPDWPRELRYRSERFCEPRSVRAREAGENERTCTPGLTERVFRMVGGRYREGGPGVMPGDKVAPALSPEVPASN